MKNIRQVNNFRDIGYSFEEIKKIDTSIEHFKQTGISYSEEEAFSIVEKNIFSKYMVNV